MEKIKQLVKKITDAALVFDGSETQLDNFELVIDVENSAQLVFTADNIREHYFSDFRKEQSDKINSFLIDELSLTNENFFKVYVDKKGLEAYASCFKSATGNNYLVIVGYGETQPSRFKIMLHGVWKYI